MLPFGQLLFPGCEFVGGGGFGFRLGCFGAPWRPDADGSVSVLLLLSWQVSELCSGTHWGWREGVVKIGKLDGRCSFTEDFWRLTFVRPLLCLDAR